MCLEEARGKRGAPRRAAVPAEWSCFAPRSEVSPELMHELRSSQSVVGVSTEGQWVRVKWRSREACLKVSREYLPKQRHVDVREGDVDPVARWLQESGAEVGRPRRCYLDFEADSRHALSDLPRARILCWALSTDADGDRPARPVARGVLEADTDAAEREMLVALSRALDDFDQVLAWNGDFFDFPLLAARSERLRLPVEWRRWLWLDHLALFRRMNANASESGDEKQSMALGKVAQRLLGRDTHKTIDVSRSWEAWCEGDKERAALVADCADDCLLMPLIEERTGYIELLQTICEACGVFPDSRGMSPRAQVEAYLMRLGAAQGYRAPMTPPFSEEKRESFAGAFVMEPVKGIHRDVHVADFSRMYPSIILSWNMSPETWRPLVRLRETAADRPSYLSHLPDTVRPLPPKHCVAPRTEAVFATEPKGLLVVALEQVLALRKQWDKQKAALPPGTVEWKEADRRSGAYKITANSFYGVIGSPFSRYFVREVGESVSTTGAWLIGETIKYAEARGFRVLYGDTDSIMVRCSRAEFEEFVRACNAELYPRVLAAQGCVRNETSIAYEKAFDVVVFVGKKRYAGRYLHFKGTAATKDSKPEIKGLEYKRGDSVRMAREFQRRVVEDILAGASGPVHEDAFVELVERERARVLEEPLVLADVMVSKRLSKAPKEYQRKTKKNGEPSALPPQVEVAYMLKDRGLTVRAGMMIDYVVVDGASSPATYAPAEGFEGEVDRYHLWEHLVYPPTQRVLEAAFPEVDWERFEKVRPKVVRRAEKRFSGQGMLPGLDDAVPIAPARPGEALLCGRCKRRARMTGEKWCGECTRAVTGGGMDRP